MTTEALDPIEAFLRAALPTVLAPRYGTLAPIGIGATRYIVGRNGLYVEARSRALHACARVERFHSDKLPYGEVTAFAHITGGALPSDLVADSIALARLSLPDEWAAVIVTAADGERKLVIPPVLEAGAARIRYDSSSIDPLDMVLDLHSHGRMAAFFSATDDEDDRRNPCPCFFAAVLGHVDRPQPDLLSRLVINGRFFDGAGGDWAERDLKPAWNGHGLPGESGLDAGANDGLELPSIQFGGSLNLIRRRQYR